MEQALDTGAYDNIAGRAEYVAPYADVICKCFTKIRFSLRLPVRKQTLILAEGTFDITAPQIETKAFTIHAGGSEIVSVWFPLFIFSRERSRPAGNVCYIIAALGPGYNIAIGSKLQIGVFNGRTTELQLLGTFPQRRHFRTRRQLLPYDEVLIIAIDLHIEVVIFLFFLIAGS